MNKGKFYLSTAIAYASGKPHIGNTYEIVLADAICRFKRLCGYDVYFQTGTDEHGQKIQGKADAAGVSPKEFVDGTAGEIKRIWDVMNTSYDKFVRTTDPTHERTVQRIFKKLYDKGDIYKGYYEGMYCAPCESFWTESQLKDGKCPDCGRDVSPAKEEAYFFKMSKYAPALEKYIEEHPDFIQPESRKNEMINNFIKPGLSDLCVSRSSFSWGIPVDFAPGHVVYVWIDALSNYITFLGYDPDGENGEPYKKYWPADVHLIGKDILRFHTIYWPIMLMALGVELPKQVFGHPWLLVGENKMSKSLGNVIYADDLADLFGVDAVRYYLLHEMPFASDGTLTYELMCERVNSDLANILGNLVNRTIAMCHKYSNGVLSDVAQATEQDKELIDLCLKTPVKMEKHIDELRVADALSDLFDLLRRANKYIDETTPWVLAKDESQHSRLDRVLYNLMETIRFSATLLSPFLPDTGARIFKQLNIPPCAWDSLSSFGALSGGHTVGQAEILFERIDIPKKLSEIEKINAEKAAPKAPAFPSFPKKSEIEYEDFDKLELTVGKVLECEPVPKSSKLLRFKLDMGDHQRQILSGIAKWYKPEELIGHNVVCVTNLKPRKMMGLESCGMILSAECGEDDIRVMLADFALPGARLS